MIYKAGTKCNHVDDWLFSHFTDEGLTEEGIEDALGMALYGYAKLFVDNGFSPGSLTTEVSVEIIKDFMNAWLQPLTAHAGDQTLGTVEEKWTAKIKESNVSEEL